MYIYKIYNKNNPTTLCYVGSTSKNPITRLGQQKSACKNIMNIFLSKKRKLFCAFIEHNMDTFEVETIESFENITKEQLLKKENEYIEKFGTLNKNKAYSEFDTFKDYFQNWKLKKPDYMPSYLKKWRSTHKGYQKAWREKNRDKLKQYQKNYRLKLKQKKNLIQPNNSK